jgi:hypothetical protein
LSERRPPTGRGQRRHSVLLLGEFSVKSGSMFRPFVDLPIEIAADHN